MTIEHDDAWLHSNLCKFSTGIDWDAIPHDVNAGINLFALSKAYHEHMTNNERAEATLTARLIAISTLITIHASTNDGHSIKVLLGALGVSEDEIEEALEIQHDIEEP